MIIANKISLGEVPCDIYQVTPDNINGAIYCLVAQIGGLRAPVLGWMPVRARLALGARRARLRVNQRASHAPSAVGR